MLDGSPAAAAQGWGGNRRGAKRMCQRAQGFLRRLCGGTVHARVHSAAHEGCSTAQPRRPRHSTHHA
eukprot:13832005-Alexandrium_andersonii.AAC.1